MSETRLHTVFGLLFVASFFLSDQVTKALPTWREPQVGVLSLVVALLWVVVLFMKRGSALVDELKILRDRIERLERRHDALEDEVARS